MTAPNPGAIFENADVARAYGHRAPYPAALFERLGALTVRRQLAIDLGCGSGKLAFGLAAHFAKVIAVDPSVAMLALVTGADRRRHPNVEWINSSAESFAFPDSCDLIVAGASIHWMDHDVVFPRLQKASGKQGVVAVVEGDGPDEAPWRRGYLALIAGWVARMGGEWNSPAFRDHASAHLGWIDVLGRETFSSTVRGPLEALIESEHSRATWARSKMGPRLAAEFDADMRRLLTPYARKGWISFRTKTSLIWGRARGAPLGRGN